MNKLSQARFALEEAHQVMNTKRETYAITKQWLADWNMVRAFYKQTNTNMYKIACKQIGEYLSACKKAKASLREECIRVKQLLDDIAVLRQPSLAYGVCKSDNAICYYIILNGRVVSTGLWYVGLSSLVRMLTFKYKLYQTYPTLHQVSFEECMAQGIE